MDYAFKAILIIYCLSPCAVYTLVLCVMKERNTAQLVVSDIRKRKRKIKKGGKRETEVMFTYIYLSDGMFC
jgi:hypothetical protein